MKVLNVLTAYVAYIAVSVRGKNDLPVVETSQGSLQGKYMITKQGREFSAFLGIPYAKPPVGQLRFAVSPYNYYKYVLLS